MSTRILIVENELTVAHTLKQDLLGLGYSVVGVAASGEEAVEMALQTVPNLILMDMILPGDLDGIATAERIQSQLKIALVYVTASSDEATLLRAKRTRPSGYLSKPIVRWSLQSTLEIALQNYEMERHLRLRSAILEAVGFATERLLTSHDWRESIHETLGRLGKATEASRIFLIQNRLDEHGAAGPLRLAEWQAPGVPRYAPAEDLETLSYQAAGFCRWAETLGRGQIIEGHVREFPQSEREVLTSCGVCSTLVVPVFVGRQWWGLLGLDQCFVEREWSSVEADALKVLAQSLGAAIHRDRTLRMSQASEERFRLIAETIDEVFWMADPEVGEMFYVSPAYQRVWGRSLASLYEAPQSFIDAVHPEDRERISAALTRKEPGRPFVHEYRVVRPDGSVRWILDRGFPARSDAGTFPCYVGIARDITEQKAAEQKLREQAALLEITRDAVLVRDLDSHVLYWNRRAEELYGWTAAEVLGKKTVDLLYEASALPEFHQAVEIVKQRGEWRGELHQITRDKRSVIVDSRSALIRDSAGQPKSILCINTDITEQKGRERAFLRAQRMESIGTLAAGIAHDLNNILAPIMMAAQVLQLQSHDQETARLLETMHGSAKRGAEVVRQVLTFGRGIEGQRVAIQPRHLLKEMVQIMIETFPRSIAVEASVPKDLWLVMGDATQLHQVLMNLCVNARDALPEGGTIRLSARNVDYPVPPANVFGQAGAGPHVLIEVTDSGQGIPRQILDKIFDPFFTTKPQGQGTGLGLSTVLGIVKSHGGFVTVESEPGQGASFKVHLPATPAGDALPSKDQPAAHPQGQGECVLVVDDEHDIREVTRKTLAKFGYEVLLARNGREALELVEQHNGHVKAVVTDLMMPVMDGRALARVLHEKRPHLRIIACTGLVQKEWEAELQALGVEDFLEKPYAPDKLLQALRRQIVKLPSA